MPRLLWAIASVGRGSRPDSMMAVQPVICRSSGLPSLFSHKSQSGDLWARANETSRSSPAVVAAAKTATRQVIRLIVVLRPPGRWRGASDEMEIVGRQGRSDDVLKHDRVRAVRDGDIAVTVVGRVRDQVGEVGERRLVELDDVLSVLEVEHGVVAERAGELERVGALAAEQDVDAGA